MVSRHVLSFKYREPLENERMAEESAGLELQSPLSAKIKGDEVWVTEKDRFGELEGAGYGTKKEGGLELKDYEALYLLHSKKLKLEDEKGRTLTFEEFSERAQGKAGDAWTKFMIYRDLRSRGYVVKEGFGFGTDLRVYERGDFPKKPAKYVVFALDEGIEKEMSDLKDSVKEMAKMGKEGIIAVIERRGEVIYYKVSRARF